MRPKRSYNNACIIEENTDSQIDSTVPYNYKQRREKLNNLVKNHIAKQQQKLTQKHKSIAR